MNTRITRLTVAPAGQPIFSESSTDLEIDDDGGGEFVKVLQHHSAPGEIRIDPAEWPVLREAIEQLVSSCAP